MKRKESERKRSIRRSKILSLKKNEKNSFFSLSFSKRVGSLRQILRLGKGTEKMSSQNFVSPKNELSYTQLISPLFLEQKVRELKGSAGGIEKLGERVERRGSEVVLDMGGGQERKVTRFEMGMKDNFSIWVMLVR